MLSNVDFASYADGNTPYVVKDDIKDATESLEHATVELFSMISSNNQMKANPDKCQSEKVVVNGEINPIRNSKCKKLLCVKIDYKLTFYLIS